MHTVSRQSWHRAVAGGGAARSPLEEKSPGRAGTDADGGEGDTETALAAALALEGAGGTHAHDNQLYHTTINLDAEKSRMFK